MLTGPQVASTRKARGMSQQELAVRSGVNKAYISEYETGIRPELPEPMMQRVEEVLLSEPRGRTSPKIERRGGRSRLVLENADGNKFRPRVASVQWTEADGTTYSIFLGGDDGD